MATQTIGIELKPDQPHLGSVVQEIAKWLKDRQVELLLGPEAANASGLPGMPRSELVDKVDLMIVLGGDGTLLSVARAIGERSVPVLGVNLGTLGYLAEISLDELFPTLESVLAGRLQVETRMRLDVYVERDGREIGRYLALNDAVMARTALSRMVDLKAWADDVEVTTYHGDGLIVATPTGSSAYSLSAGGPLLLPGISAIVLTPICPHALTQRPIVLPEACQVAIQVLDTRGGEVHLTVDGQVGCELREDDRISMCASTRPLQMLVPAGRNRFEVMRNKLRWGTR
ncbi:MAG: NAD(+)/NADH kinase [Deltaproteobacteria bacterium]|nr:NAD(+)/NADH kinase [Deltaproteobacteria bacterium]